MTTAERIVEVLGLEPHPEGGWYRETHRSPVDAGGRSAGTVISFLLEEGPGSHWHRVDADEIWLFQAGDPLVLSTAPDERTRPAASTLGPDVLAGQRPQLTVPAGHWQAAATDGEWSLVACVVIPGFRFEGFELAAPGFVPGP